MTAYQLLIANLVRTAIFLTIVGLLVRRRANLCWSYMAYLTAILVGNVMISFWPERFFKLWFYTLKESVYNMLMLCVAAELTYRVFRSFPGALSRARMVLAPLLAVTAIGIMAVPAATDHVDFITRYNPQVQTGGIWLFSATAVLTVWYNIPVRRLHRTLLLSFTSYLIIFATLGNVLRAFGYLRLHETIGMMDVYASLALMTWWAVAAWRSEEPFEVQSVRELSPKLA